MKSIDDPLFAKEEIPIRSDLLHRFKIESVTGYALGQTGDNPSQDTLKKYSLQCNRAGYRVSQYKFDENGKVTREWMYDSQGKVLKEVAYETSGEINFRFDFLYDRADRLIEKRMYLSADTLHYRVVPQRNSTGRMTEEMYYDASGQQMHFASYTYDDAGKLVRIAEGHTGAWVFEYDQLGNLTRKTGNLPSMSVFGETFEYQHDEQGLLTQIDHLHDSTTKLEYTFYG